MLWALFAIVFAVSAPAQVIELARPGEREFIVDKADLINAEDEQQIKQICDKLLTDAATPIVVVTIESMAKYLKPGRELPWETFARVLFDEWGIGHLSVGTPPNAGILVLVSRNDRKARIELGAGWSMNLDAQTQRIMQQVMVPNFKRGDFSKGIRDGVAALDESVRQRRAGGSNAATGGTPVSGATPDPVARYRPPSSPSSSGSSSNGIGPLVGCGGIGLVIALIVIFLIARGMGGGLSNYGMRRSRGWYGGYDPGFWTGWGLGHMMGSGRSSGSSSSSSGGGMFSGGGGFSGGGFSGGSFGGGFSGGRGASGSW